MSEDRMSETVRLFTIGFTRKTAEEDLAEDFCEMFQKLDQFRGDMPFEHWVARSAVNPRLSAASVFPNPIVVARATRATLTKRTTRNVGTTSDTTIINRVRLPMWRET